MHPQTPHSYEFYPVMPPATDQAGKYVHQMLRFSHAYAHLRPHFQKGSVPHGNLFYTSGTSHNKKQTRGQSFCCADTDQQALRPR